MRKFLFLFFLPVLVFGQSTTRTTIFGLPQWGSGDTLKSGAKNDSTVANYSLNNGFYRLDAILGLAHNGSGYHTVVRSPASTNLIIDAGDGTQNTITIGEDADSVTVPGDLVGGGLVQGGTGHMGGAVSYTDFESDGTIEFLGDATVFEDLAMSLTTGKQGATSKPDFDYDSTAYMFPVDSTEVLYLIAQMPHSYKQGSNIYPHVHFKQSKNSNPSFKIQYKWFNIADTIPAAWSHKTLYTLRETYSSGLIHQMSEVTDGLAVTGTGKTMSSILLIRLKRDNSSTYSGDCAAFQFDIHYEKDTNGSRTLTTK
jgi:hypothetical protein